ncbi:hypothetical protein CDAR_193241 [Caerostris darwini]|uniref:Secreted protein n=1 Tax=Caerostris darwini TaxID=1538125 RepID=A0AAV4R0A7_9ARAC|nr:hypothetical protein CDAR_193241 [Caerostris darwini]
MRKYMQCMRKQRSRKRKLFFVVAISFLSIGNADDLAWWQLQATILEKLQMKRNIQCMKQQSRERKLFFMWAISFLCSDDIDGLGGSRELLSWRNFRRGANTMHEQQQSRQKKTCPK